MNWPTRGPLVDEVDVNDALEWSARARGENALTRLDRHYSELLQEMRVAQTGVQILFAFLLGLAFTPRFAALTREQHVVYVATLLLAATSAALLIAPVSYHRLVYQQRMRPVMVATGHRYLRWGLFLLVVTFSGAVQLAASLVVGRWAWLLALVLAVAFVVFWYVIPVQHRRRASRSPS